MEDKRFLSILCQALREKRDSAQPRVSRITDDTIEAYQNFCSSLDSREQYPCPVCFIVWGRLSDFYTSNDAHSNTLASCRYCGERIVVPPD